MDDLQTLATLLAKPDPSSEVADRSRHRLQNRMRGPVRARRRIGLLVPGLGLATAVAAAVVVVIATGATAPTVTPASAKEILLVAAASAERTPEGSGTYWHVRREVDGRVLAGETWTRRDGRRWSKGWKPDSDAVVEDPGPFTLGPDGAEVSFEDLRGLPADTEALKAWIAEAQGREASTTNPELLLPLSALVSELPAPPRVRAAAYRAIAALPGVESLGAVDGGQGLLIPHVVDRDQAKIKLVVDPETSQVKSTNFLVMADGGVMFTAESRSISVTAEWTDQPPR
ncbi:CU044_5270 family protein [Nonomuraea sp. NPDC046570]|uniref:CU044_5270 family protein n=1 Tax=Nonomuraea sp. NPDC046570 TaxID=3155255 RepID=UPI0033F9F390